MKLYLLKKYLIRGLYEIVQRLVAMLGQFLEEEEEVYFLLNTLGIVADKIDGQTRSYRYRFPPPRR